MPSACAVTITAREQAELLPMEADSCPLAADEVRGPTLATLVSAGTEIHSAYLGNRFPAHLGYAAVFRVMQVGAGVARLKPGDTALCLGPHRSFQRTTERLALPVPQGLSPESACFARLMGVSMSTLATTTARPSDSVLVTGLGPVGHLAARIFALCGYEVTGVDPDESRRTIAADAGIRALQVVPLNDPTNAGQVALVLECSGHEQAALDGIRMARKRGEVVLVGVPWQQRTELTAHAFLHEVFHRYVVVRSGWEWELPNHPADFRPHSIYGSLEAALRWLAEGRITLDGLYATAPPSDCQRVYDSLLHHTWPRLAAIFDWHNACT